VSHQRSAPGREADERKQELLAANDRSLSAAGNPRRVNEEEPAKRAAEAAGCIKSSFLSNLSHELRTPLNVIIGSTEMLLLGRHGPVAEDQLQPLERVRKSADLMLSLINACSISRGPSRAACSLSRGRSRLRPWPGNS